MRRWLAGALLVLAGCGTRPPEPPPAAAPVPLRSPAERARDDYEAQLRRDADGATNERRWSDAALAWELIATLRPADAAVMTRLAESRARVEAAVVDQQERADQAVRRGDFDTAAQAWWAMLALDPSNQPAAAALRQLEIDRNRKTYLGRHAGSTLTRRAIAESEATPAAVSASRSRPVASAADLDRAAALADDGEYAAAAALLEDRRDAAARRLLIQVVRREAEAFAATDPVRSRSALERIARLDAKPAAKAARPRVAAAGAPTAAAVTPLAAASAAAASVAGRSAAPL